MLIGLILGASGVVLIGWIKRVWMRRLARYWERF